MRDRILAAVGIVLGLLVGIAGSAFGQSSPGLTYGQVPTAAQWNSYFAAKQDVLGYTPVNRAGDTMSGPLTTVAPTSARAGFTLPPGTAPSAPVNGNIWVDSSGLFVHAAGSTIGPIGVTGGGSVTSVTCGSGLTGGTFTVSGTCALSTPVVVSSGGTGKTTAAAARSASGLNIESYVGQGDTNYTIQASDHVIGTTAAFTVSRTWTLPAASAVNPGAAVTVADVAGVATSTHPLTIQKAGSDTVNGGTSVQLVSAYSGVVLVSDGVSKWTAGAALPLAVASGGTGSATAAGARVNLGVQSYTGHGDSTYTILATDNVVGTTAALTASRTWTLPAAASVNPGQPLLVADFFGGVSSTHPLILARASSDTINGATSVPLTVAQGAYLLYSDGVSKWAAQATGSLGMPTVADNTTLASLPATFAAGVTRLDYASGVGAPPVVYTSSPSACSLGSGVGDGGSQVQASNGGCWLGKLVDPVDARVFGARGDGSTDSSAAVANAFAACGRLGGGRVAFHSTGAAYVIGTGFSVPSNCHPTGDSAPSWGAFTGSVAQITATGSWLECTDLTNPCMTIVGTGVTVDYLNMICPQSTPPSSGSWTPTTYPYAIYVDDDGTTGAANNTHLEHLGITSCTHCVNWEGPSTGVAGIDSGMNDIYFNGCFNVGTRFHRLDNTMELTNLRYDPYWYIGTVPVQTYIETHKIDWDMEYIANPMAANVEFYESWKSIYIKNGTVTSGFGTSSVGVANLQGSNISFNEVCQAISPDSSTDRGNGTIVGGIVYRDTSSGACPGAPTYMFDLSSNFADWTLHGMHGGDVQGVAAIGSTSSLRATDLTIQQYSFFGAGATAFALSSGGGLSLLPSTLSIGSAVGAGNMMGCGLDSTCGFGQPIVAGIPGGEGSARLDGSSDNTHAGDVSFFAPDGTRRGFIGRGSTGGEINIDSDNGNVLLNPASGKAVLLLNAPSSCSGQPTGALFSTGGAIHIC